jgi:hypothetical protein
VCPPSEGDILLIPARLVRGRLKISASAHTLVLKRVNIESALRLGSRERLKAVQTTVRRLSSRGISVRLAVSDARSVGGLRFIQRREKFLFKPIIKSRTMIIDRRL